MFRRLWKHWYNLQTDKFPKIESHVIVIQTVIGGICIELEKKPTWRDGYFIL